MASRFGMGVLIGCLRRRRQEGSAGLKTRETADLEVGLLKPSYGWSRGARFEFSPHKRKSNASQGFNLWTLKASGGHAHCSFPSDQMADLNYFLDRFMKGQIRGRLLRELRELARIEFAKFESIRV